MKSVNDTDDTASGVPPIAGTPTSSGTVGTVSLIPPRLKELAATASQNQAKPQETIGSGVHRLVEKAWAHVDDGSRVQKSREASEASRRLTILRLWAASGVLKEHRDFVEKMVKPTAEQLKIIEILKFCLGTGAIYALYGRPGVGKTQMAACMVWCACREERAGMYLHAGALHAGFHAASMGACMNDAMQRYHEPYILAIDEIGRTSRESTLFPTEFTRLVDWRHANGRGTLLLSNLDEPSLRKELGISICERMKDGGGFLHMDGPSFRGQS